MIQAKTYVVGKNYNTIHRLDNLAGNWVDVSSSIITNSVPQVPLNSDPKLYLNDIEVNSTGSRVITVGKFNFIWNRNGIYYSDTNGASWTMPEGDYASLDEGNVTEGQWYEVCIVESDNNNVFVCGSQSTRSGGKVCKSINGGIDFNSCTPLPYCVLQNKDVSGYSDAYSIHFIDENIGVVGGTNNIFTTADGGTTWITCCNGNGNGIEGSIDSATGLAINNPGMITGVHCKRNSNGYLDIVAISEKYVLKSYDSGISFTVKYAFATSPYRGLHLTWIDDNRMWATGTGNIVLYSTDAFEAFEYKQFPLTNPRRDVYAAHFYNSLNGFYSGYAVLNNTTDGGSTTTGLLEKTFTQTPLSGNNIQAVWTWYQQICYLLTPCDGGESIIVTNDLSTYENAIIEITANGTASTYTVTEALSCENSTSLYEPYTIRALRECPTYSPVYLLEDCSNPDNQVCIYVDGEDPFLEIVDNGVIRFDSYPDICWKVLTGITCDILTACNLTGENFTYFKTCIECNPLPVLDPQPLRTRSVLPGYYSEGCDVEYTEKINCQFSTAIYNNMVQDRYGVKICCDIEEYKLYIKKRLLDLNAIYDSTLCGDVSTSCCNTNTSCNCNE